MQIATFELEQKMHAQNDADLVIGVDEVGRGPLAGPVVAAACVLRDNDDITSNPMEGEWRLIRDSKKLSELQRQKVQDFIKEKYYIGIGIISPRIIDRDNILQATFQAMQLAVKNLAEKNNLTYSQKTLLLLDGSHTIPNIQIAQQCVIGGDKDVKAIAAASIAAKITRDYIVTQYEKDYPQYGFSKHKGYGTKAHLDALELYGATPVHRKSFRPVRDVL